MMVANQVQGFMQLVVQKGDGSQRIAADWFPNLITNAGLNRIGVGNCATHAWVGSGRRTPNFADTELQNVISKNGPAVSDSNGSDVGGGYAWFRRTFRFAPGTATGTVQEVGIAWSDIDGLFSRALVKDSYGSPTAVTVLADESLDVNYEFRIYWPTQDVVQNALIDGTSGLVTIRPMLIGNWGPCARDTLTNPRNSGSYFAYSDAPLGGIDTGPGGAPLGSAAGYTIDTYVNDSFEAVFRARWSGANISSASDIRNFGLSSSLGLYKMSVNPTVYKDGLRSLNLAIKVSWSRMVV